MGADSFRAVAWTLEIAKRVHYRRIATILTDGANVDIPVFPAGRTTVHRSLATCKPSESNGEYNFGCACICCTIRIYPYSLPPCVKRDMNVILILVVNSSIREIISLRFDYIVKNSRRNYDSVYSSSSSSHRDDLNFDHRWKLSTINNFFSCVEIS